MDVRIETPFPAQAVPRIWIWTQEFRWRVADDFGPKCLEDFVMEWRERERAQQSWAVYCGEELGGVVTVQRMTPIVATSHCIFKRTFWGPQTTLPALRLVYEKVFDDGYEKILSFAFRDNAQLLGLARKLGAEKEGVLRKQTKRNGRPTDMIAIGLLKEDFVENGGK